MRQASVLAAAALVAAAVILGAGRAAAQDATPTVGRGTIACAVEPRPTAELLALWYGPGGIPVGTPGSTGPAAPEPALPQGDPPDGATVAAVDAAAREFLVCLETDQNTRAYALMTDDLVRLFVPTDTIEQVRAYLDHLEAQQATPPASAERIAIAPLRDVRVLDEGRVGAVVETGEGLLFLFLERQGGRWLVDGFVLVDPDGTPDAAS